MMKILIIGLGGFLGAVSRYLIARFFNELFEHIPLGTLMVNILGSFILGLILYSITLGKPVSNEWRDFLVIGFLGSLTTMSTFSYETFRLFELKYFLTSSLYLFLTIILCLLAVMIGRKLALYI